MNERDYKKMFSITHPKSDPETKMFYISIGFIFLLVLAIVYPVWVNVNVWIVLGFVFFLIGVLAVVFPDAMRIRSPGLTSEIHHTSLRYPDPWRVVSEHYIASGSEKSIISMDFAIFPLGGYQYKWFYSNGGGRYGYVIVLNDLWQKEGASVNIHAKLVRIEFASLPPNVQSRLPSHPGFSFSSPIWIGLVPSSSEAMKSLEKIYNVESLSNIIGNLTEIFRRTNADVTNADATRRVVLRRSMESVLTKKRKKVYVPENEYEEKSDE